MVVRTLAALLLLPGSLVAIEPVAAMDSDASAHYAPALGERRAAVMLVKFSDRLEEPGTPLQVQDLFDGPISDYFAEASYQQMQLTTDVFGWWTLPVESSRCSDGSAGLVSSEILEQATQRGVDVSSYDHLLFVFNDVHGGMCPIASGTVSPGAQGKVWRTWPGSAGTDEVAFDGAKGIETTIHEMGHNLGLYHANLWNCGDAPIGDTCSVTHYGDIYDAMGSGSTGPHFNPYHKERLGWISTYGGSVNQIQAVTSSGYHTVAPYEEAGGIKALKIPRGAGESGVDFLYVEYRQPIGWDRGLREQAYNGLLLRVGNDTEPDSSRLLDMSPEEPFDHSLPVGQEFHDPVSGVRVEAIEVGPGGALVRVTLVRDVLAPQVEILAPLSGGSLEKGTQVMLKARAVDDTSLGRVEFHMDGSVHCVAQPLATEDEYGCPYDVPKGKSRTLTFEARAVDAAGNLTAVSVTATTLDSGSADGGGGKSSGGGGKGKKR